MSQLIIDRLLKIADRHGGKPMIRASGEQVTYEQMWSRALKTASIILAECSTQAWIGVLADRDHTAYLAILAILAAGKGYVPLNPALPDARLARVVRQARLSTVLIGQGQAMRATTLFKTCQGVRTLINLHDGEIAAGGHDKTIIEPGDIANSTPREQRPASESAPAYLLFTSGSTGEPKGVAITNANLCAYLDFVCPTYGYAPQDCHSQTFELTFDLSVHDMMCAWTTGGSLAPIVGADLLSAARIIRHEQITCWFSVPTLGLLLQRTRALKPNLLQSLRVSLFCGEPLPESLAQEWQRAAPDSVVENLYGPTEATIAFTRHRWSSSISPQQCRYGLVPIGKEFGGSRTSIACGRDLSFNGETKGELWLAGPQVTSGYLDAPEETAAKFCEHRSMPGVRWYRTGDIVERDVDGELHFVGRLDDQIKFRGHRINLLEIEAALRDAASTPLAVVVAHPCRDHEVLGITGVVEGNSVQREAILQGLAARLPDYMIPHRLVFVRRLPRNLVGKIDKLALRTVLSGSIEPSRRHARDS